MHSDVHFVLHSLSADRSLATFKALIVDGEVFHTKLKSHYGEPLLVESDSATGTQGIYDASIAEAPI